MSRFLDEMETHIPALRRYARALTGDADRADDLVQDCLERAIRKKALWRPIGGMRPWLFKILLNLFRNEHRRRTATAMLDIAELPAEPAQPAPQPGRLALSEVRRALDRLPGDQREALLLVALEGLSYAEAAQALSIPQGTLMSRLSRARANLRKLTGEPAEPHLRAVK